MARKQCFMVCSPSGNIARKQCFLVCSPSGNMAGKQCFLVCQPSGNMASLSWPCNPKVNKRFWKYCSLQENSQLGSKVINTTKGEEKKN